MPALTWHVSVETVGALCIARNDATLHICRGTIDASFQLQSPNIQKRICKFRNKVRRLNRSRRTELILP
jgi:hypothetical protein